MFGFISVIWFHLFSQNKKIENEKLSCHRILLPLNNWVFAYPENQQWTIYKFNNFSICWMQFLYFRHRFMHLTTYNFQSEGRALHRRHRLIVYSSYTHISAIDLFPDHRLRSFSNRRFHQSHQPHTTAHSQRPTQPVQFGIIFFFFIKINYRVCWWNFDIELCNWHLRHFVGMSLQRSDSMCLYEDCIVQLMIIPYNRHDRQPHKCNYWIRHNPNVFDVLTLDWLHTICFV